MNDTQKTIIATEVTKIVTTNINMAHNYQDDHLWCTTKNITCIMQKQKTVLRDGNLPEPDGEPVSPDPDWDGKTRKTGAGYRGRVPGPGIPDPPTTR